MYLQPHLRFRHQFGKTQFERIQFGKIQCSWRSLYKPCSHMGPWVPMVTSFSFWIKIILDKIILNYVPIAKREKIRSPSHVGAVVHGADLKELQIKVICLQEKSRMLNIALFFPF